jgi:hypothetical protein
MNGTDNAFLADLEASIPDIESNLDAPATAPQAPANVRGRLLDAAAVTRFALAGKATLTLVSEKTGARFTYRISANNDGTCHFVALLNGPDNESDYKYLGRISRGIFWQGRKVPRAGDISADAPSAKAFAWAWRAFMKGAMPDHLEVWHESHCGRCGRRLTVPSSVSQGFGPECINKIGIE